jgi:predicted DNA-binding mobile mystery protein A
VDVCDPSRVVYFILNLYLDNLIIISSYNFMTRRFHQDLRLTQLSEQLLPVSPLHAVRLPRGGWLRAIRQALGRSLKSVAGELKISPQAIHQLEKSEAAGTISLKQLEAVSRAMGCHLVYTLVPNHGTLSELANAPGERNRKALRHSMALEGQAVEDSDKKLPP